jgi:hypothetical protein
MMNVKGKGTLHRPGQALKDSKKLRFPEFLDNPHMKMDKLSALCTGCLYPQEIPLVLISVQY